MRFPRLQAAAAATTLLLALSGTTVAVAATTPTTTPKKATTSPTTAPKKSSTATSSSRSHSRSRLEWRVISGVFKTRAAAEHRIARLDAKGLTGFTALHRNRRWEVERTYRARWAARREEQAVRRHGFGARVVAIRTR